MIFIHNEHVMYLIMGFCLHMFFFGAAAEFGSSIHSGLPVLSDLRHSDSDKGTDAYFTKKEARILEQVAKRARAEQG